MQCSRKSRIQGAWGIQRIKEALSHVVFLSTVIVYAPISSASAPHAADRIESSSHLPNISEVDAYLRKKFPTDAPGAAVLVMKDGKELLSKGYGLANVELNVLAQKDTIFHAASIGKQFTAAAILRLADQGKLEIHAPIGRYIAGVPEAWNQITVENLLTHTSGIQNLFNDPTFFSRKGADMSAEDQLKYAESLPLLTEPGTKFNYASVNYVILSMVISKLSGQLYQDYINKEFLRPLGMLHTTFDQDTKIIRGVATPYGPGPSRVVYVSPTLGIGAGSFYTTNADLAKWVSALYGGRIIDPRLVKLMTTEYKLKNGEKVHYGYGLRPHQFHGTAYIESSGDIPGFHSETVYMPESKIYISILSTGEDRPWFSLPLISKHLAILTDGGSIKSPHKIKLRESELNEAAGRYQALHWVRNLKVEKDHLVFQDGEGAKPEAIIPMAMNEYYFESEPDLRIRFEYKNGRAMSMQLYEPDAVDDEQDAISPKIN